MTAGTTQPVESDDNITRPDPSAAYGGVRVGHRTLFGYLLTPLMLLAVLVGLYFYVRGQELSSGEQRRLNRSVIATATWEHIQLTLVSTVLVLLIAIPMGIFLTRPYARVVTPPALALFNVGQAVPSIGLIALLAIVWDIGFWPAVVALVAYTVLPVLRNTMVGLTQVDASVIESARGMGMTRAMVLARIELPLAVPIIMAGLRTALTINVGTATLGTFIGAGGLGGLIVAGFVQNRPLITVVGAILVAVLALTIDYVAGIAEELLRPKGL